ncbi:MAG: hypothetical protein FWF84_05730, partial [Kiritimatiellaeota bacterium]|nr:hypothetical protein [Kiritimatiellota bacterium]
MNIAVLAEYGLHAEWVAKPLTEAGFTVDVCPFQEVPERLATGKYNVLVLGRYYSPRRMKQAELRGMDEVIAAAEAFVRKGGGLYLAFTVDEQMPYKRIFSHFGMEALELRIVQEGGLAGERDQGVMYTTAVHPDFAEGVRGMWLPVDMGLAAATRPLKVKVPIPRHCEESILDEATQSQTGEWVTVLSGEITSRTKRLEMVGYGLPGEELEGYKTSVPVMMAREVGSTGFLTCDQNTESTGQKTCATFGRVAVSGIPGGYYLFSPNKYPMVKQLLSEGFEGKPSDGLALFVNMVRWLGEPSAAAGTLGGAQTNPEALLPQVPRYPKDPPVRWAGARSTSSASSIQPPWEGLIGARTAYSSGEGTVAEYVAKAKAAGHQFIVFLEEFASLTAENYAALQKECEAFSTADFLAVPGYVIQDCVGTWTFQYGYTIGLPKEDILSEDGKRLATKAGKNPRNEYLDALHLALVFGECNTMRVRRGMFRHAESPKTILQNRACDSISLVTWEDGKIIEDVRDYYPTLMDKGLRLHPVTLALMKSPEDFDRAVASGWKTMILEPYGAMQDTVLRKIMATELEWWSMVSEEVMASPRFRFDCWQYGLPFQSITSGPVIRAWTMSASGRDVPYGAADHEIPPTADLFRVDVLTMRLRIHVTSACGLKEVVVRDGKSVIRRWLCDGNKEFEMELDILHDQQRQFLL